MRRLKVDPTDLKPGDIVIQLEDHELDGCHCDVVVTVLRPTDGYPSLRLVDTRTGRQYWEFPDCELFYLFNWLYNIQKSGRLSYQGGMLLHGLERWAKHLDKEESAQPAPQPE